MAITMMVDKEVYDRNLGDVDFKVIENWQGHKMTLYMQTTYKGLVVDLGEINGYDDSDFYAVVWDTNKQEPKRVIYASTRGWSYANSAVIDATPVIAAAYQAYKDEQDRQFHNRKRAERLMRVERGKVVKVVRGRKLPKGLVGRCFWVGQTAYGFSVGIETPMGREFTALKNVEVCLPECI